MYIPTAFAVNDDGVNLDFVESHSFGVIVSQRGGECFGTHLPFFVERGKGVRGELSGHMARVNPQWEGLEGEKVMVIFSGPHAYVSPTWYEAENVVPTWNYVAVHVYGVFRVVQDEAGIREILKKSVDHYEAGMEKPWAMEANAEFNAKMAKGVVGFRIEIERIEGKWKLNQNHPAERRAKVIAKLEGSGDTNVQEVADLMRGLAR